MKFLDIILKTHKLSSTPALKVVFVLEELVAYFLYPVSLPVQPESF
jgi:hypothetical protein